MACHSSLSSPWHPGGNNSPAAVCHFLCVQPLCLCLKPLICGVECQILYKDRHRCTHTYYSSREIQSCLATSLTREHTHILHVCLWGLENGSFLTLTLLMSHVIQLLTCLWPKMSRNYRHYTYNAHTWRITRVVWYNLPHRHSIFRRSSFLLSSLLCSIQFARGMEQQLARDIYHSWQTFPRLR